MPLSERSFQVKNVGTTELQLQAMVSSDQAAIWLQNLGRIFCLCCVEMIPTDQQGGDVTLKIKLRPDNGIIKCSKNPFPWERVTVRCRRNVMFAVKRPSLAGTFSKYSWPLSCEDLFEIGYCQMVANIRNWSHSSAKEISAILSELGHPGWENT